MSILLEEEIVFRFGRLVFNGFSLQFFFSKTRRQLLPYFSPFLTSHLPLLALPKEIGNAHRLEGRLEAVITGPVDQRDDALLHVLVGAAGGAVQRLTRKAVQRLVQRKGDAPRLALQAVHADEAQHPDLGRHRVVDADLHVDDGLLEEDPEGLAVQGDLGDAGGEAKLRQQVAEDDVRAEDELRQLVQRLGQLRVGEALEVADAADDARLDAEGG